MAHSDGHDIYSRDATVYVVSGEDKLDTFHRALDQAGLFRTSSPAGRRVENPGMSFRSSSSRTS
jgi:hypothetical protein